jgi:hypothetical protein
MPGLGMVYSWIPYRSQLLAFPWGQALGAPTRAPLPPWLTKACKAGREGLWVPSSEASTSCENVNTSQGLGPQYHWTCTTQPHLLKPFLGLGMPGTDAFISQSHGGVGYFPAGPLVVGSIMWLMHSYPASKVLLIIWA